MDVNGGGKSYMRAGELAAAAGVSTDTLRHYERKGVLQRPRRSPNGYREYPREALARVMLVRRALAAAKLSGVEARLVELTALRDELRLTLTDWDSRLSKTGGGARAGLLESLAGSETPDVKRRAHAPDWRTRKRKTQSKKRGTER